MSTDDRDQVPCIPEQEEMDPSCFTGKAITGGYRIDRYNQDNDKRRLKNHVAIPAQLGGTQVIKINKGAFQNCKGLTSVSIPDGVQNIEPYAFRGCTDLSRVNIPAGVNVIRDGTFMECTRLTAVPFHSGVKAIMKKAFAECYSLTCNVI